MLNTQNVEAIKDNALANKTWNQVKQNRDLIEIAKYRNQKATEDEIAEVDELLQKLRAEELENMKQYPSKYSKQHIRNLVENEVFSYDELEEKGLITSDSWEKINLSNRKKITC